MIANFDCGEYQLPQVKADATAVGEALRGMGLHATIEENVPVKELKTVIERFARQTRTNGVAVLYFAGLAGQYRTYNSNARWRR